MGTMSIAGPVAGLCLCFVIFSLYTVLMKKAISEGSSPVFLALLREVIAVSVLLPVAYVSERRKPSSERRFWPSLASMSEFVALGAVMIYGVQLLSAMALEHISATTYAVFAPTVPVVTLAIALVTKYEPFNRHDRLSWMKIASVCITAGGALFVAIYAAINAKPATTSADGKFRSPLLGLFFLCCNKLSVSTYPVMEKRLLKTYPPLVIVAWGYAFGAILTLMATIPLTDNPSTFYLPASGWLAIAYSALLSSAFNYSLSEFLREACQQLKLGPLRICNMAATWQQHGSVAVALHAAHRLNVP